MKKPLFIKFFLYFIIFILLPNLILSNNNDDDEYTNESLEWSGVTAGLGTGTIACIVAICVGALICIFGFSTTKPYLFIFIGFVVPAIVILFCIFCPRKDSNEEGLKMFKLRRNIYILWRYLYFVVMIVFLLFLIFPYILYILITVIPEKVDSSTKKSQNIEKPKERKIKTLQSAGMLKMGENNINERTNLINNNNPTLIVSDEDDDFPNAKKTFNDLPSAHQNITNTNKISDSNRFSKFKRKQK